MAASPGFDIHFANGNRARAVHASGDVPARALLEALALPSPQLQPLVVLNGGTDLTPEKAAALRPVLGNGLAQLAASEGFTVLTGDQRSNRIFPDQVLILPA